MATQIIPESPGQIQHLESVYERGISALNELNDLAGMIYSVASAGKAFVGEAQITEQNIFSVIERLTEDTFLTSELRKLLAELAKGAGLSIDMGANHG